MNTNAARSPEMPGRGEKAADACASTSHCRWSHILGGFFTRREPKSILQNQTNLPMFFVIALGLSILCNFTLRENTAEASRPAGMEVSIEQLRARIRMEPDDYQLHSLIAELYLREKNFRRAMFHLTESSRLIERFGE